MKMKFFKEAPDPKKYMEQLVEGGHPTMSVKERAKRIKDLAGLRKISPEEAARIIDEQIMAAPGETKRSKLAGIDPDLAKMKIQATERAKALERKEEPESRPGA